MTVEDWAEVVKAVNWVMVWLIIMAFIMLAMVTPGS